MRHGTVTGDTRPIAMMGFNYRWDPLIQQAHARIAAGAIGQPMALRTVFSTAARGIPEWKRQRDSGGGVLLTSPFTTLTSCDS